MWAKVENALAVLFLVALVAVAVGVGLKDHYRGKMYEARDAGRTKECIRYYKLSISTRHRDAYFYCKRF